MYNYFKGIAGVGAGDYISSWKTKGLSDENITAASMPNNFPNPSLEYLGTKPRVRFRGSCLKQNAITYNHGKSVNIYIVEEKMYSINFTEKDKKFCLSLHYNGANSYLFVNGKKIHEFKAKDSKNCSNSIMLRKHFKRLVSR